MKLKLCSLLHLCLKQDLEWCIYNQESLLKFLKKHFPKSRLTLKRMSYMLNPNKLPIKTLNEENEFFYMSALSDFNHLVRTYEKNYKKATLRTKLEHKHLKTKHKNKYRTY